LIKLTKENKGETIAQDIILKVIPSPLSYFPLSER